MPLNIPGLLATLQLFWNPRVALPHVIIGGQLRSCLDSFAWTNVLPDKDIRQLDFLALRQAGYRGAVFDKDNCLTTPYEDALVPQLEDAWKECRQVFGEGNVFIVSNSAGTPHDAGQVQAESVSYHLSVPVLRHRALKPAYSCVASIRRYFGSLGTPIKDEELVIVGDRIFTDVVMANRMHRYSARSSKKKGADMKHSGPLAVWTTGVWQRESMMVRWLEKSLVDLVTRWTDDGEQRSALQTRFTKGM